jgi:ribosomal protein S1
LYILKPLSIIVSTFYREKINDKVLVAADVEAGLAVNCIITEVRKKDLIVQINNWHHLKAKVPAAHLSDAHISDISKRFTKGQRIKGRVSNCSCYH